MFEIHYAGYNITKERHTRIARKHGSGDYLFLFFISPMELFLDGKIVTAKRGSFILYTPGVRQDFAAVRDFRCSFVRFGLTDDEILPFDIPVNEVVLPVNPDVIDGFMSDIYHEFFTRDLRYKDALDGLMNQLLVAVSRGVSERRFTSERDLKLYRMFLQARFTMLTNCESEWASTNMSGMVELSRSQFYKYYTDFFGVSPMSDLQKARIEKAKNLLINDNLQVTEVAEKCGYASIHHFSRTFKEHCGMSPLNYLKEIHAMVPTDLL